LLAALPLVLGLAACGEGAAPASAPTPGAVSQADAGYLTPPQVTAARVEGDTLRLTGSAPPSSRVRLATPEGQAMFADADSKGDWRLSMPRGAQPRIFGLSAVTGGRTVQSEGYLLLTPEGEAALLRAGAGAVRVGRAGKNDIDAVDFDREGGAIVSGRAPAGAALSVHVDGRKLAEGRADTKGRYVLAMTQPLESGPRQIDVFGDATENPVVIETSPAAALSSGPFRASSVSAGLRIDWMTPGGGVQSTILLK
jgi:hypothetical protein